LRRRSTPPEPVRPKVSPRQVLPISRAIVEDLVTVEPVRKSVASELRNLPRPHIDLALQKERIQARLQQLKRIKIRRWAFRGAAAGLVVAITLGGLVISQNYLKVHKAFQGTAGTAAALKEEVKPELLKGEGRGRVNILLMGRGGGNHDAPDLTDTLIVASVDPVNKTATLMSVPRDLWVNVPDAGVMKLNAAFQSGQTRYMNQLSPGTTDAKAIKAGFDSVDKTLDDVLGITIDYHVLIDFKAFQQAVDSLGGVDVNVPADLVDPTMAWENANNPVLAKAGPQNFDGHQALLYARSRETSSDFARSERQRALLLGIKAKTFSLGTLSNPAKISGLFSAFGDNVKTDLSLSNANRLYSILKDINDSKITSVSLADAANPYVTTGNVAGQSVVLPKAGLFKYDDIRNFVRSQLRDPYIVKEKARVLVLNGTVREGLATAKADELRSYGYNVVGTGNTPGNSWSHTTLIDLTHKYKYTKNYLEQRFNQKAASSLSDPSIPTNGADFVIIVGSDEGSPTQN
jgi:LCP family protein required for cell wall assembly